MASLCQVKARSLKEKNEQKNYNTISQTESYNIVVVGKTGNGKSAVCNTLLGQETFPVGKGMSATTVTAQCGDRTFGNMNIKVIDTPDVTNCGLTSATERQQEVSKWKSFLSPSTHPTLLLLTVRCDVRYTAEEHAIFRTIRRLWGDNFPNNSLVVAFTFGDCQDDDIKDDVKHAPPELKEIVDRAKHRYVMFTNTEGANREEQARRCFETLQNMREGSCCPCAIL